MFNYNHYVPILKAKYGEFGALSELPEEIKNRISPVIDIFNSKLFRYFMSGYSFDIGFQRTND